MTSGAASSGARARLHQRLVPIAFALVGMVVVLELLAIAFGQAPAATLERAVLGSWGSAYGIGQVLFKATPLVFTGLAFDVGLRAGLFNIGAEGQLVAASFAGAVVASRLPAGLPWPVAIPIALGAAAAAGALAALVPAWMRARLGVHEILSAIMFNRVIDVLAPWALAVVLGSKTLRTPDVVPGAALPRLDRIVPALAGSAASVAFPLAVVFAFGLYRWLDRSRVGRQMRWLGMNPEACRAEGIDTKRRIAQALLLSGALAGLAMSGTVLGYKGCYELGLGAGAGFSGIAVAMLGGGSATGIVLAAVLLGSLEQAGFAINARVPKDAMDVLEAVAIVLVAAGMRRDRAAAEARA